MREYFASGRILDFVLTLVTLEIIVVLALRTAGKRQLVAPELLAHLVSAAGLLAAAHMVIARGGWVSVGCCLMLALSGHLLALRQRAAVAAGSHVTLPNVTLRNGPPR